MPSLYIIEIIFVSVVIIGDTLKKSFPWKSCIVKTRCVTIYNAVNMSCTSDEFIRSSTQDYIRYVKY